MHKREDAASTTMCLPPSTPPTALLTPAFPHNYDNGGGVTEADLFSGVTMQAPAAPVDCQKVTTFIKRPPPHLVAR